MCLPRKTTPVRRWFAPATSFLLAGLAGCANTGAPKPPSLHLPKAAEHLAATRVGDRVELDWVTSSETTDGETLRGSIKALLCRSDGPAEACRPVQQLAVTPGASHVTDRLPPGLAAGKPALLTYRMELLNGRGRSAGRSSPVYAAAGEAPPAVGAIMLTARRNGVQVTWQPTHTSSDTAMELHRTQLSPRAALSTGGREGAPGREKAASESTLRAVPPGGADPGGTIDRTVRDGDVVSYQAQRVLTVALMAPAATAEGKGGKSKEVAASMQTLQMRGEASPPARIEFHDVIPPGRPEGLAAIPAGGFGQRGSIDLSWEPNPEADVAGYNVYRAEGAGAFRRLNPEPVFGPAYRDLTAQAGTAYVYHVTAIDVRGNESAPTPDLKERLEP